MSGMTIKPAAPWVAAGVLLSLSAAFLLALSAPGVLAAAIGGVGAVSLAIGVYRLVQHVDRREGYTYSSEPAPGSDAGRARQAEARAALLREQSGR